MIWTGSGSCCRLPDWLIRLDALPLSTCTLTTKLFAATRSEAVSLCLRISEKRAVDVYTAKCIRRAQFSPTGSMLPLTNLHGALATTRSGKITATEVRFVWENWLPDCRLEAFFSSILGWITLSSWFGINRNVAGNEPFRKSMKVWDKLDADNVSKTADAVSLDGLLPANTDPVASMICFAIAMLEIAWIILHRWRKYRKYTLF